jgi:hypothetical protein
MPMSKFNPRPKDESSPGRRLLSGRGPRAFIAVSAEGWRGAPKDFTAGLDFLGRVELPRPPSKAQIGL